MRERPEFNAVVRLRFQQVIKGHGGFTIIVEADKGDLDEKDVLQAMELLRNQLGESVECFFRNTADGDKVDMVKTR